MISSGSKIYYGILEDYCIIPSSELIEFSKNITLKASRPHGVTIAKVLFEAKNQPTVTK